MKIFEQLQLRQEMVDFQRNDTFGPEMEIIIDQILDKVRGGYKALEIQKLNAVKELEALIFRRMKMRVSISTFGVVAAIIPFFQNDNHVLLKKFFRNNELLKEQEAFKVDGLKGTVNLKKAELGGVYSDYVFSLYLNFNVCSAFNLTSEEIVAVLLHELGHGFDSCGHTARLNQGNQIFSDAMNRANGLEKEKAIEVIFRDLKDSYPNIKKEVAVGLTSSDPILYSKSVMQAVSEIIAFEQDDATYNRTSFEQMADGFATRFGYGPQLSSALAKMHTIQDAPWVWWYAEAAVAAAQAMVLVLKVMITGVVPKNIRDLLATTGSIGPFALAAAGISRILMAVFVGYYYVKMSGEAGRDFTYDDLKIRFNRIRQQLIEQIKRKELTESDARMLLATLETQRELIEGLKIYRGPIDWFFNTFNPADRRAKASIERQQAIEGLMNNELFVQSLQLKQLSK